MKRLDVAVVAHTSPAIRPTVWRRLVEVRAVPRPHTEDSSRLHGLGRREVSPPHLHALNQHQARFLRRLSILNTSSPRSPATSACVLPEILPPPRTPWRRVLELAPRGVHKSLTVPQQVSEARFLSSTSEEPLTAHGLDGSLKCIHLGPGSGRLCERPPDRRWAMAHNNLHPSPRELLAVAPALPAHQDAKEPEANKGLTVSARLVNPHAFRPQLKGSQSVRNTKCTP